jgi:hypothetical protein
MIYIYMTKPFVIWWMFLGLMEIFSFLPHYVYFIRYGRVGICVSAEFYSNEHREHVLYRENTFGICVSEELYSLYIYILRRSSILYIYSFLSIYAFRRSSILSRSLSLSLSFSLSLSLSLYIYIYIYSLLHYIYFIRYGRVGIDLSEELWAVCHFTS